MGGAQSPLQNIIQWSYAQEKEEEKTSLTYPTKMRCWSSENTQICESISRINERLTSRIELNSIQQNRGHQ